MFGWGEKWSDLWRGENKIEIGWDVCLLKEFAWLNPYFFLVNSLEPPLVLVELIWATAALEYKTASPTRFQYDGNESGKQNFGHLVVPGNLKCCFLYLS